MLAEHAAVPLAGATDLGRGGQPARLATRLLVAIDHLPELRVLTVGDEHIDIGAALSLTEIERRLDGAVPLLDEVFPQFASRLIRNGATIGGNLGTASPIGDLPPALLALDAVRGAGVDRGRAGRCRSPTTSPATARPCCSPAS